jgi:hypothetical protein
MIGKEKFMLPVYINMTKELNTSIIVSPGSNGSCSSLGGYICLAQEICEGEILSSLEGNCCIGNCNEEKSSTSTSQWISFGLLVIIVAGMIAFYFFKKAKDRQKQKSPEELLKEKSEVYSKRMQNKGEEVKGRLDTI